MTRLGLEKARTRARRLLGDLRQLRSKTRHRIELGVFERHIARLFEKYRTLTMVPKSVFSDNLRLCRQYAGICGSVVECGVWRGGMVAAMAEVLGPARHYYLFDSFEGLPAAKPIDGESALAWQANKTGPLYYDNCRAEVSFAEEAMRHSGARSYTTLKGWFQDTLRDFRPREPIAILRLDGDWYDSTMECLTYLYPLVKNKGLIIVDDYYTWDGCARAVHDFLSRAAVKDRIHQTTNRVAYIAKNV